MAMFPKSNSRIDEVKVEASAVKLIMTMRAKPTKPSDLMMPRPPEKSMFTGLMLTARMMETKAPSPSQTRCCSRSADAIMDMATPAWRDTVVRIAAAQSVTAIGAHPRVTADSQTGPGSPSPTAVAAPDHNLASSAVAVAMATTPSVRMQSRAIPMESRTGGRLFPEPCPIVASISFVSLSLCALKVASTGDAPRLNAEYSLIFAHCSGSQKDS
jgi:hypothetical protein